MDCRVKPGNDAAAAVATPPVTRGLDPRVHRFSQELFVS